MLPEIVEVTFKRNRTTYCWNSEELDIKIDDHVIVEAERGIDLGRVTQVGRLVMLNNNKDTPCKILRKASKEDINNLNDNRKKESLAFAVCRELIEKHSLNMKLVDTEFQFDENKLTFYFTSDRRVDFRELVKDLASKYRTRIELRQIGVREEAKKLGGIGICGKSLCCSSILQNFSPISTQDAKQQNLSLNPSKLSGTCGRLKCCLLYEKGFYNESLLRFPSLETPVQTDRGIGYVDKVDIFNDFVFLRFDDDEYEQYSLVEIKAMMHITRPSG